MQYLLEVDKVTKVFGGLVALSDVEVRVRENQITGLIGPNGAGKTTLFLCIMGRHKVTSGRIIFDGRDITNEEPYKICRLGVARTNQIVRPFNEMTVLENVVVAALYGQGLKDLNEAKKYSEEILKFVGLDQKKSIPAKTLTLALKRRLELARALATKPKLILMDEVLAGLTPTETLEALDIIRRVRDELGVTVFWIEHVMDAILNVAEYVFVLDHGKKICEGPPSLVRSDARVIEAYMGRSGGE